MSWIHHILPKIKREEEPRGRSPIPEGVWTKCPGCEQPLYTEELEQSLKVCPKCGHHFRLGARSRLLSFFDPDSAREIAANVVAEDFLKFVDSKPYPKRLESAHKATGETDAIVVMEGTVRREPMVAAAFEFGFMFLAPALYVIYALLYAIFTVITVLVGFRAGFSFSAGLTDLVFSASLPAAQNTLLIIPLGIAAFLVFYVVFRFAIVKFDLKTPGREDDDDEAEKSATLSNNNFTEVATIILEGVGGKENVTSISNCITRLRLEIKDYTKVDEKKIKSAGVAGVVRPSKTDVQVIVGMQVQFVADEFKKLCK